MMKKFITSGPGSKLFANVIIRRQKSPLARKGISASGFPNVLCGLTISSIDHILGYP